MKENTKKAKVIKKFNENGANGELIQYEVNDVIENMPRWRFNELVSKKLVEEYVEPKIKEKPNKLSFKKDED